MDIIIANAAAPLTLAIFLLLLRRNPPTVIQANGPVTVDNSTHVHEIARK